MARLSNENTPEHLAALQTPNSKPDKDRKSSSRFKDFFKGGHSRSSVSAGAATSSPDAATNAPDTATNLPDTATNSPDAATSLPHAATNSPDALPPSLSPTEKLKPGFEKVGLHPSERSRVLDLDEWEKLKEENQELSHPAKIQLYKEKEKMKERDEGFDTKGKGAATASPWSTHRGGMGIKQVGHFARAEYEDKVATAHEEFVKKWMQQLREKAAAEKAESLRKACEGSSSESDALNAVHESLLAVPSRVAIPSAAPAPSPHARESADEKAESLRKACEGPSSESDGPDFVDAGATAGPPPVLRHSPPVENLRSSAHDKPVRDDSISTMEFTRLSEIDNIRLAQQIADAIDVHEFRFHRAGLADIGSAQAHHGPPPPSAADRIRSKILADLGISSKSSPATASAPRVFKIGPWQLDGFVGGSLAKSLLPLIYIVALFFKAIHGPTAFFLAVWNIAVVLLTYVGLRRLLKWDEDGSIDVVLAPVEELGTTVKEWIIKTMATCLEVLAHGIVMALKEMEADNSI